MLPDDLSILQLTLALAACVLGATIQGVVGFGFSLLSVPLCALISPSLVPVPQAVVSLFVSLPMAWHGRRHIEFRRVAWILAGWVPGVAVGIGLLKVLSPQALNLALALFVLGTVALLTFGMRLTRRPPTEVGVGVFAGLGSLVSSISGPPVALLYRNETGASLRANLAFIFVAGVLLSLLGRVLSGEIAWRDMHIGSLLLPAVVVALQVAKHIAPHVEGARLRKAVLILATASGVALLIRAL